MTYGDMEAFLSILRNGSITAAADALFITQPALSRKLKSLEQELGVRLWRRSGCPYTARPSITNPVTPKRL